MTSAKKPTHKAKTIDTPKITAIHDTVEITELSGGENRELDEEKVERLRASIRRFGLINPITVNVDNVVLGGYHRLEACKREGILHIQVSRYECADEVDGKLIQIHENTMRAGLTFSQKMEYAKWMKENLVAPQGRRHALQEGAKTANLQSLENQPENGQTGELGDVVVEHGLFGSQRNFYNAKTIADHAIPQVIEALDKDEISIHRACQISKTPQNRQKSLLKRMLEKRKEESAESVGEHRAPKALKVKGKMPESEYDFPTRQEDKYNLIRVAPDWWDETFHTICSKYAIAKYASGYTAVCIEVNSRHLQSAFNLLDMWQLHYKALITIGWTGYKGACINYVSQEPLHIVIAQVNKDLAVDADSGIRMESIYVVDDPRAAAIEIITEYFEKHTDAGGGYMLDMTANEPRDYWDIREIKFRKNSK